MASRTELQHFLLMWSHFIIVYNVLPAVPIFSFDLLALRCHYMARVHTLNGTQWQGQTLLKACLKVYGNPPPLEDPWRSQGPSR